MKLYVGQRVEYDFGLYNLKPCLGTVIQTDGLDWQHYNARVVIRPDDPAQGGAYECGARHVRPAPQTLARLAWYMARWWAHRRARWNRWRGDRERARRERRGNIQLGKAFNIDPKLLNEDQPLGHDPNSGCPCFACEAWRSIQENR